ncbi:MAG: hypothetical protein AB7O32_00555 [Vicinamibacterales bacterium]
MTAGLVIMVMALASAAEAQAPTPRPDARVKDPRDTVQPLPLEETHGVNRPPSRALAAPNLASDPCVGRTDGPCEFPRADLSKVTRIGKIRVPCYDSLGNLICYGAGAFGFSEDGTHLYVGCRGYRSDLNQDARGMIWEATLPPVGGTATEIHPCRGLTRTQLDQIAGPGAYFPLLGGIMQRAGKICVNGYVTYDTGATKLPPSNRVTWACGPDLDHLSVMVEGSVRNGLVMRDMTRIPPEWQAMLRGDTLVDDGFSSIISRASYGESVTSFYMKDAGTPGFAMHLLLGCPEYDERTGAHLDQCSTRYGSPTSPVYYNGSEESAGAFIVPGTRTLVVLERESDGPTCYGYATRDPAQHGQPYRDAVYCYSLSDPLDEKGPKGFPYRHVRKLFDLAHLVDVIAGRRAPWDVLPYAIEDMPDTSVGFKVGYTGSGTFNALNGQHYLARELYPNGQGYGEVDVYGGFPVESGSAPPPPPPCPPTGTLTITPQVAPAGTVRTVTYTSACAVTGTMDDAAAAVHRDLTPVAGGSFTIAPTGDRHFSATFVGASGTTPFTTPVVDVVVGQQPPPPPTCTLVANAWPGVAPGRRSPSFTWGSSDPAASGYLFSVDTRTSPWTMTITTADGCNVTVRRP